MITDLRGKGKSFLEKNCGQIKKFLKKIDNFQRTDHPKILNESEESKITALVKNNSLKQVSSSTIRRIS